ncbi:MAG: hypothetical protein ACK5N0_09335 [Synechococcaceae cyanobacterium]
MGPLHCPLCIGLALLSILRTAAYGVLMARLAGFGSSPAASPPVSIRGPALAH